MKKPINKRSFTPGDFGVFPDPEVNLSSKKFHGKLLENGSSSHIPAANPFTLIKSDEQNLQNSQNLKISLIMRNSRKSNLSTSKLQEKGEKIKSLIKSLS